MIRVFRDRSQNTRVEAGIAKYYEDLILVPTLLLAMWVRCEDVHIDIVGEPGLKLSSLSETLKELSHVIKKLVKYRSFKNSHRIIGSCCFSLDCFDTLKIFFRPFVYFQLMLL